MKKMMPSRRMRHSTGKADITYANKVAEAGHRKSKMKLCQAGGQGTAEAK